MTMITVDELKRVVCTNSFWTEDEYASEQDEKYIQIISEVYTEKLDVLYQMEIIN